MIRIDLSVIVPTLNEAGVIGAALAPLQKLRTDGLEVIVADGGSNDSTPDIAAPLCDRVIVADHGRSRQMNAGAAQSTRTALLFLHADTRLPEAGIEAALDALRSGAPWGRFDVVIDGHSAWLPMVAWFMNARSRLSGIATGDQALFMTRAAFDAVKGYPDQPLMEDIEISKRLKQLGKPACLRLCARTSGRRWDQRGVWRTIVLMWGLRLIYFFGATPDTIHRLYHGNAHGPR
jgi:rSAM/selenodomain-associated transferase 2